jgi:hypothetical protein
MKRIVTSLIETIMRGLVGGYVAGGGEEAAEQLRRAIDGGLSVNAMLAPLELRARSRRAERFVN